MLCTLFKRKNITKVHYNRADLTVLKKVMKLYDVDGIEFTKEDYPIKTTMTTVYNMLATERLGVIHYPNASEKKEYCTYQLTAGGDYANDRKISHNEMLKFAPASQLLMDTQDKSMLPTTNNKQDSLTALYNLMSKSSCHISCDSGTAWVAISMGVKTIIVSKNSLYYPAGYFAMKYANIHDNVTVYQEGMVGVRLPSEMEYNMVCAERIGKPLMSYAKFISWCGSEKPE